MLKSPAGFIDRRREDLDHLSHRLTAAETQLLGEKKREYVRLAAALDAMSPLKVLARGFSVTTDADGRVVRDPFDVAVGDIVHIQIERGSLDCRVEHQTGESR